MPKASAYKDIPKGETLPRKKDPTWWNVDPSTVAVTNESPGAWWPRPYHERYRIIVDFDFDGHDDMILSEPISYFGTGGGCWSVYHWTNGTYQAVGDLAAHLPTPRSEGAAGTVLEHVPSQNLKHYRRIDNVWDDRFFIIRQARPIRVAPTPVFRRA